MCGILGMAFMSNSSIKTGMLKYTLRGLLAESEVRGSHATGVAFVQEKGISVLKDNVGAKKLMEYEEFGDACTEYISSETISVLGHCRFKTKGTPKNNHNNHPIVTGNIVGIHNGMIHNDEMLWKKYQTKFKSFKRKGKVDSEIIFKMIDHYVHVKGKPMAEAIDEISYQLQGDYACALVDRTMPYMLWLFRNINPITIYNYPKCGIVLFASNSSYIDKTVDYVCKKMFGEPEEINLLTSHCLGINLKTKSIYKFKLDGASDINGNYMGIYEGL